MKPPLRAPLLLASAVLMTIGTLGYTFVILPDLRGDLIEIGVRPTVLGGTVLHLYFAAMAMVAFTVIVATAAIQALRGTVPARAPLALIALIYTAFGVVAFSRSHNPHHLGPVAMGVLIAVALAIPGSARVR